MTNNKKSSGSPVVWLIIGAVILFSFIDEIAEDSLFTIITLMITLAPIALIVAVVFFLKKQFTKTNDVHTHDRINHSSDLKINPNTGKAVNRVTASAASTHSAKEHWKQQLDTLLANGTIDRAEYSQMLKRKF